MSIEFAGKNKRNSGLKFWVKSLKEDIECIIFSFICFAESQWRDSPGPRE